MVGRKNKYDSACYYAGKKIGGCTVADGDAYVVLMNQCNYDAARVLREYAYFSPELKEILTKVAEIQAKSNADIGRVHCERRSYDRSQGLSNTRSDSNDAEFNGRYP